MSNLWARVTRVAAEEDDGPEDRAWKAYEQARKAADRAHGTAQRTKAPADVDFHAEAEKEARRLYEAYSRASGAGPEEDEEDEEDG